VDAQRDLADDGRDTLLVTVGDDGTGMPVAFDPARAGLGTQTTVALIGGGP
jgi:two-component sensor histidine kinase